MPKQLGPIPPSAALLGGLKPLKEDKKPRTRQEPGKIRDKTGNGEHTTPMEATNIMAEDQDTTTRTHHTTRQSHRGESTPERPAGTSWFSSNAGLSKSALRDIETIEKSSLPDDYKMTEIREIIHADVVARKAIGVAGDVLIIGGSVVLVVGLLQVTLWAVNKMLGPSAVLGATSDGAEVVHELT
jgi:hypothetical protein